MTTLEAQLEKVNSKIENGKLLVSVHGDSYSPINLIEYSYQDYTRLHFCIDSRLKDIKAVRDINVNKLSIDKIEKLLRNSFYQRVKSLQEEIKYDIKIGDYVEFKHFGETIKGYIEEVMFTDNNSVANIEKEQFCHQNSWGNYIIKYTPLKHIKENLINHIKSDVCSNVLIDLKELELFFENMKKHNLV